MNVKEEEEEWNFLCILQVNDLISNNQLNICSEEKVFLAVLNWLKHDLTERQKHIYEVLIIRSVTKRMF